MADDMRNARRKPGVLASCAAFAASSVGPGKQNMLDKATPSLTPGTQRNFLQERVVHGRPAAEVIVEEAAKLGKSRIFITTSGSLSGDNALPREIGRALGDKFAGLYSGITAHTPRQCVIDGAAAARAANADL